MLSIKTNEDKYKYDIQMLVDSFSATIDNDDIENMLDVQFNSRENGNIDIKVKLDKLSEEAIDIVDLEFKNTLKQLVYKVLHKFTGKELPWGVITGIRPTKLAMVKLEENEEYSDEDICEFFKERYYVSHEKAMLSAEIARYERELLKDIDYKNGYSLYIGIPFCPSTCLYCSFTSYPIGLYEKKADEYVDCLIKEIEYAADVFKSKKLNTVYFGGGTPTTLTPAQLDKVISKIKELFDFTYNKEFTVEAGRPDSVTRQKLEVLRKHGVTRISINPQTMKQETLDIIGRKHTVEQVKVAFMLAREMGFDNINMDFIAGLPNETVDDVRNSMEEVLKLKPDSLTIHSLAIKRAARLAMFKDDYKEMSIENNQEIMHMCNQYAKKLDMKPYYLYRQKNIAGNMENVGYATKGKAGIYNILIMEEMQTILALGAGSITKYVFPEGGRIERVDNVKNVDIYIERIDEMIERKRKFFRLTQQIGK